MKQKLLHVLFGCMLFFIAINANSQGGTLPLNSSVNGTLTSANGTDVYSITTTADGLIRLTFHTVSPADLYVTLYDKDGTTAVSPSIESYNNSTNGVNIDGLAKGTYYAKITAYNSNTYGSYTLADSFYTEPVANDAEPNGTSATALTLPLNGNAAGHVGFYYNNQRDTADWYKVTTTANGLLRLTLSTLRTNSIYANNALDLEFYLYDHDGTTVLGSTEVFSGNNPTTGYITVDGLAPGSYYIKIQPYSSSEFASYKLSDSLYTEPVANDAEPNGTPATAVTLARNSSTTGQLGFYYNQVRDSLDWYKVTTNANGLLRIAVSTLRTSGPYANNALDMLFYLYDHDGTTLLTSAEAFNGNNPATAYITYDGLAAGTYYIKIQPYSANEFGSYTLTDSLYTPSVANDNEPDNTPATAITLPQNGTLTGQVGYYYNHVRDTTDWYKVTTTQDGLLRLTLTTSRTNRTYSNNGLDMLMYLYDIDGTTLLGSKEVYSGGNPTTDSLSVDRLAAGTYYVKLIPYSSNEFANYTLSDNLLTYNPNDKEPNDYASEARTIPANETTTGHIGFYFNGGVKEDYTDWFKINYTGTGNLKIFFDLLPHLSDGGIGDVFFQVYKDTAASPIFNQEFYGSNDYFNIINLSSLTEGYYYIKILPYSSNPSYFTAYSILDSFTQVDKAKIQLVSVDSAADCSGTNSITVSCSKSHSPYSVTLYRFDSVYAKQNINKAKISFTFSNLPTGQYYAKVYGDGATGNAFGKTPVDTLIPVPTGLTTTNITQTSATFNWNKLSCVNYYTIEYMKAGAAKWTSVEVSDTVTSYTVTGLKKGTDYVWRMNSVDSSDGLMAGSAYTPNVDFATPSTQSFIAGADMFNTNKNDLISGASIYPNPASSQLHIRLGNTDAKTAGKVLLALKDVSGKIVWSAENANAAETMNVDVSRLPGGIYMLQIIKQDGTVSVHKIIIAK